MELTTSGFLDQRRSRSDNQASRLGPSLTLKIYFFLIEA